MLLPLIGHFDFSGAFLYHLIFWLSMWSVFAKWAEICVEAGSLEEVLDAENQHDDDLLDFPSVMSAVCTFHMLSNQRLNVERLQVSCE